MTLEETIIIHSTLILLRLRELIEAPLTNPDMVWAVIPLIMSIVFITFYFGRHQKEELGWNTAFGNTMVFIFMAISLLKELYYRGGGGSLSNLYSDPFTLALSACLVCASVILMLITSLHLLPKRIAFFLFSTVPVNVTLYVLMCAVYARVPLDALTAGASLILLLVMYLASKSIQFVMRVIGLADLAPDDQGRRVEVEDPADDPDAPAIPRRGPGGAAGSHPRS